jgi:hypothetical protein
MAGSLVADWLDTATAGRHHEGSPTHLRSGPTMTDAERDHLLQRISELERAKRRWKWLALAGTPLLGILLVMTAAFGTSSYLLLRDSVRREQHSFEMSRAAVDEMLSRAEADLRDGPSQQETEQFLEQARRLAEQPDE